MEHTCELTIAEFDDLRGALLGARKLIETIDEEECGVCLDKRSSVMLECYVRVFILSMASVLTA